MDGLGEHIQPKILFLANNYQDMWTHGTRLRRRLMRLKRPKFFPRRSRAAAKHQMASHTIHCFMTMTNVQRIFPVRNSHFISHSQPWLPLRRLAALTQYPHHVAELNHSLSPSSVYPTSFYDRPNISPPLLNCRECSQPLSMDRILAV